MSKKLFSVLALVSLVFVMLPATMIAAPEAAGTPYTVQKDDWLSKLAEKEYGDPLAYPAIVYFNNLQAQKDATFTAIEDPDSLEVGWTLFLPDAADAAAYLDMMGQTAATGLSGQLQLAGSTTVQPLAEELAEAFMALNPGLVIEVQGGGSSVGVTSAGEGTVDIGNASRNIKDSEFEEFPDLQVYTIAFDGIAIVTNPGVEIPTLSVAQVQSIFAGEITNFSEVGGPDAEIIVVSREEGSGTRAAFEELVMAEGEEKAITEDALLQQSNGQVRTTVASTPNSIGYLSFGFLDGSVNAVPIDGVAATVANVGNGSYSIFRPLNMLTNGTPNDLAAAFLGYILNGNGQAIVVEDYIPVQ